MKTKFIPPFGLLLSLTVAGVSNAYCEHKAPDVPPGLQVPAGCKVSCHAYAIGVQIYTATPSLADPTKLVWTFTAPEAVLFDADGGYIGIHYAYAGPSRPAWESESGSFVVATRTVPPVIMDASAIPWLRLEALQAEGPGIFKRTAYIQRVNTTGGLAPIAPPAQVGEVIRVPYTAEYFFFRAPK
jgi:hypothetical protein